MLSAKQARMAIKIMIPILIAALSFFVLASKVPDTGFVQESLESLDKSSNTVMEFSAATLSTSLAISALPDDFATPLADSLADMNIYFIAILVVLFLEKILLKSGIRLAFSVLIPLACGLFLLSAGLKKRIIRSLAVRVAVLGLALVMVVPCSTHLTELVASDFMTYIDETIDETNDGADKLNEAMKGGAEEKTVFEKLSDLFQTAIRSISDLMQHFQNTIRRCMNSIAILIVTNCLMPLLTFVFLRWILRETFHIVLPMPPIQRLGKPEDPTASEPAAVGE